MGRSVIPAAAQSCIFWGKIDRKTGDCLPLAAHCLDVGLVFRGLCSLDGVYRALTCAAGEPLSPLQLDRLAVLAMLHDAGKANLGFQLQVFDPKAPKAGHIRELAPLLDLEALDEALHEAFVEALSPDLPMWFADEVSAYSYLLASFSHHGRPLIFRGEKTGTYFQARKEWWRPYKAWDPMHAIRQIIAWARAAFPAAFEDGPALPGDPRFHHRFAGLVMLADWIGSNERWFPIEPASVEQRLEHGRRVIPRILRTVGLDASALRPVLATGPKDFKSRFRHDPYPLQAEIDALDPHDPKTRLIVAESETGSGKTEAALNWFFKLFAAGKVDGLYFALPTRVAARELYGRIVATMERWFPRPEARPVTVLAVPGYAQVDGGTLDRALPDSDAGHRWQDDPVLERRERQWAAERPKRFLAATVAVGTVDQVLLSIVQTAHAHLRSVCLDRQLLVIDEIHASDVYMSRLARVLVHHHLDMGGSAMLMSATLGARARHHYVTVGSTPLPVPDLAAAQAAPFPAITLLDGHPRKPATSNLTQKCVHFGLLPIAFTPQRITDRVVHALAAGARVLVVMNTVQRTNALLRALESHPDIDPGWLFACKGIRCPHHGRFAPADRPVLDRAVTLRFGKDSPPGPILLIGTQTLEQSLDIDADLMITDLAPADVLLQRVGRLHRHARPRPPGYDRPRCLVLTPADDLEAGLDDRGYVSASYKRLGYGSVYADLRTLELTRRLLEQQSQIRIPQDNRRCVEAATHPQCLATLTGERWTRHAQHVEGVQLAHALAAGHASAPFHQPFGELEFNEDGDRVVTRLGADNLQLPLEHPIRSPFGQTLRELVIPGHMAPEDLPEVVSVEDVEGDRVILRCADRRYLYSRFGLEEVS